MLARLARSLEGWMSERSRKLLPVLVAIVVPMVLFSWSWAKLQKPPRATGKAAGMERKLKNQKSDVVVLGSSLARTNVNIDLLASELGVGSKNVTLLTLPNATAAHWYAVMKNRVFANGHRPKVVVMVGALTTMITPEVLKDSNVERLVNQLSDREPVLGKKVFGTLSPADFRYLYMREQAGQIRDEFMLQYRDWALGWLMGNNHKPAEGKRLAERANEIVFADERMDYSLHMGTGTGLWGGAVEEIDVSNVDIANDSLISDIGSLARDYGSYAVFVRTPFPPSNSDNDLVSPNQESAAVETMEGSEAGYVDMRSLNLDDSYFQDMRHMSAAGAEVFTKALARSLQSMGVLKRKGKAEIRLGVEVTSVERIGTAPDLGGLLSAARQGDSCSWSVPPGVLRGLDAASMAAAGQADATPVRVTQGGQPLGWTPTRDGCSPGVTHGEQIEIVPNAGGDIADVALSLQEELPFTVEGENLPAWWVYPGTTVRFTFERPWQYDAESFRVFLLGHVFGGQGGRAEIVVDEQRATLEVLGTRAWLATNPDPPTEGPWTLDVISPPDGPWVLMQNLAVGAMPNTAHLIGLPELLNGASIRLVGGKVEDTELDPVYRKPPPTLNMSARIRKAPRGLGMISLPAFAPLADAPHSRASIPHKCSPLRVVEGGTRLPEPHSVCLDVANLKAGKSCHAGNVIYFAAADSQPPVTTGKKYTLELDETRVCDRRNQKGTTPLRGVLWMYPGDHLVLTFPEDKLADFFDGANRLEIEVESPVVREGDMLDMRLYVDDQVFLEERMAPPGEARRGGQSWTFEPPIPPRTRKVRLEFRNAAQKSYWLLLKATLSEDYDYGFSPHRTEAEAVADEGGDMFGGGTADPFGGDPLMPDLDIKDEREPTGMRPPLSARRVGEMPVLPPMKPQRRTSTGALEGNLFSLWPVSNSVLGKRGLEWWSPIQVFDGEVELRPAQSRKEYQEECDNCFLHIGQLITSRPPVATSAEQLRVALRPELPTKTASGRHVWWVYPTTGVEIQVPAWSGEQVHIRVEIDTFSHKEDDEFTAPYLAVGSQRVPFVKQERGWVAEMDVESRSMGEWSLQVHAPEGGPFVVIYRVDYEDEQGLWRVIERPRAATEPTADEIWDGVE